MRGSRTFCQRGSKFEFLYYYFFLIDEGREDQNTAKKPYIFRFLGGGGGVGV